MEPLSRPGIQIVRINGAIAYILLYAAMYAAFGVASPFWPKFFETKALTSQQIGFILGAAMLVRLAAGPLVGRLADISRSWRLVLATCAALAAATALLPRASARSEPRSGSSPAANDVHGLFRIFRFRILLLVSALVFGSHAMHDAFAVIRWSDAGMHASAISILWSEAVVAEVIVFLIIGPALLGRIGTRGAAALAAVAGIIRWSVAGVTTSVWLLSILQPLHGLTFALLHLACMRMMAILVPFSLFATAPGVYAFVSGLATSALTLLSGILYASYGGGSFFPMAVLCAVALPFAWFGFADKGNRCDEALET